MATSRATAQGSAADVLAAVNTGKKNRESGKKRINVEVSDDEFRRMKALAALNNDTITGELNRLIEDYLAENEDVLDKFMKLSDKMMEGIAGKVEKREAKKANK